MIGKSLISKMTIKNFILALFLAPFFCFGQDLDYAREVIQRLTSQEFQGRGYVAKGDQLAAQYIENEFEKNGLKQLNDSYAQKFPSPVNTFPSNMDLRFDSTLLMPGVDYLIQPYSPGISGTFPTINLDVNDLNYDTLLNVFGRAAGKIIIVAPYKREDFNKEQLVQIDNLTNFLTYSQGNPAAGTIFLTNEKLTWGASSTRYSKPTFYVKDDSAPGSISEISVDIGNEFNEKYKSRNVIGFVEGENSDSIVVLTAHYDHLGMMGSQTMFPGANDNASGVAMLLNLAQYYSTNKPKYNTVFIAFGGEELGLVGSKYFVQNPLIDLKKIKFLLNFDMAGTGDDGIQVVNGSVYQDQFGRLVSINKEKDLLPQVKTRGEACNSDHCSFHAQNVPCFYIYTLGGIQAYHDINDIAATLPLTEFEDYFKLMVEFVSGL